MPPGEHRFYLQARDPLGNWSPAVSLPIRQQPELHQTWWFALLVLCAAAAAAAGLYRWRVHNIRLRYAAVLDERNRIAREWHDTLVAGFSAISLQLEATLASLKPDPDRAAEIVDITRKMVHHYRAEARRVIWDLRDSRPEGESLPSAIRDALHRLAEGRQLQCEFHLSGEPAQLPAELEHNLLRICQEAAANALRHARPSLLEIRLDYQPDSVTASIRDNGAGFHLDEAQANSTGHFGLTVMRERARRFGGSLEIESRPGDGTIVVATIPVNGASPS
jgi:signal transduction histidine kinase